ncbi:hypothetical protein F383_32113 [Gossypium arboreum]|uniref:Myb/SANT-like domain-containing protein n=1 Tax=Gossypium arboreum TaxID=29729 RepID=A0A0B0N072_GOSAR|nr:hypothetical protein F383_32113 [Gossypium arboreum]
MLIGKDNSGFGWDEHRQMIVAEDISHKPASQFRHCSFPLYDQFTSIYTKYRATGKDVQTTVDIDEEIDVEDVPTVKNFEERNNYHACKDDVSLDNMDVSSTQS